MNTTRLLAAAAATIALAVAAPVASADLPTSTFVIEKITSTSTHTWDLPRTQVGGPKELKDPVCSSGGTFISGSGSQTVTFKTTQTARFKLYWLPGAGAMGVLATRVGGISTGEVSTRTGKIVREVQPGTGAGCDGATPAVEEVDAPYDCGTLNRPSTVGVGYEGGRVKLFSGLVAPLDGFETCPILTGDNANDTKLGSWVQSARKFPMAKLFNRKLKRHVIAAKLVQTFKGTHLGAPWTGKTTTEWTLVLKRVGK